MRFIRVILLLIVGLTLNHDVQAQKTAEKTRILFLLDASNSMYSKMDNQTRMNVAKAMLIKMVDSLQYIKNLEIALRVYGHGSHRTEQNCRDTKLEVAFSAENHQAIKDRIKTIRPRGTTLIAYSLQESAYDFPDTDARNIVILITDGIEECDGDPCSVSRALQKQGVILKPFIIGVGLNNQFRKEFECVGKYYEANSTDAFKNVLRVVISQALNNTTCQINLLNEKGEPKETDVNISFIDSKNRTFLSNVVHTLGYNEKADTIYLDPALGYDIKVHTIPPIEKHNIIIKPGDHTVIDIPAAQGFLNLEVTGLSGYGRLPVLIRKKGSSEIIHVQDFNTKEKYLTGLYDIEILSLPKIHQRNVQIVQSRTMTIKIQQPGKIHLVCSSNYIGDIYVTKNGQMEWVHSLDVQGKHNTIVMQPGEYQLILRDANEKNMLNAIKKPFKIYSGKVTDINL
jgi:Ca-activated chloride channel homolog